MSIGLQTWRGDLCAVTTGVKANNVTTYKKLSKCTPGAKLAVGRPERKEHKAFSENALMKCVGLTTRLFLPLYIFLTKHVLKGIGRGASAAAPFGTNFVKYSGGLQRNCLSNWYGWNEMGNCRPIFCSAWRDPTGRCCSINLCVITF